MRDVVHLCLAASDTLLNMCIQKPCFSPCWDPSCVKMADHLDFD